MSLRYGPRGQATRICKKDPSRVVKTFKPSLYHQTRVLPCLDECILNNLGYILPSMASDIQSTWVFNEFFR